MDQQRARFVSGAAEKGVPAAQADAIFELVAKFAGYGFNKSHAAAYALIAYQTAWLKANHPVEFFAASMSLDISNTDKLAVFYQDATRGRREGAPAGREPLRRRLRGRGRRGALCAGRRAQRRPGGHGAPGRGARGGRAVRRPVRLRRAGRSAPGQQARAGEPGPRRRLRLHPPQPRPDPGRGRHPDRPRPGLRRPTAPRPRSACSATSPRPRGRACPRPSPGRCPTSSTRSWRRSASTSPATRWRTWSRCCAAGAPTLYAEAVAQAEAGQGGASGWPAWCAAARSAPRPAPARSSPSSPCPTPPASTRCCSRPSSCASAATCWSPARRWSLKVRAKCRRRRGALLRRRRRADREGHRERRRGPAHPPVAALAPRSTRIKKRLEAATNARGGEVVLIAAIDGGREVELKLPGRFTPGRRRCAAR